METFPSASEVLAALRALPPKMLLLRDDACRCPLAVATGWMVGSQSAAPPLENGRTERRFVPLPTYATRFAKRWDGRAGDSGTASSAADLLEKIAAGAEPRARA